MTPKPAAASGAWLKFAPTMSGLSSDVTAGMRGLVIQK
jgi:hypothetical protein